MNIGKIVVFITIYGILYIYWPLNHLDQSILLFDSSTWDVKIQIFFLLHFLYPQGVQNLGITYNVAGLHSTAYSLC